MYDNEITLMLLVGFSELGCTAGGITRRVKPLPLPLMVLSTQSPIGTAGPVYGWLVYTGAGAGRATTARARAKASVEAINGCIMGMPRYWLVGLSWHQSSRLTSVIYIGAHLKRSHLIVIPDRHVHLVALRDSTFQSGHSIDWLVGYEMINVDRCS